MNRVIDDMDALRETVMVLIESSRVWIRFHSGDDNELTIRTRKFIVFHGTNFGPVDPARPALGEYFCETLLMGRGLYRTCFPIRMIGDVEELRITSTQKVRDP